MAKIAFILLTHKEPERLIAQVRRLTATGDFVSIHFDGRARPEDYAQIRAELDGHPGVAFAKRRLKCGWGEWSLVEGSLEALRAAAEAFPTATHFYMLSGDCMQIKTAEYARAFLEREDVDYIESFDFFASDWIKTGIKEERLIYRHWFNERKHKTLFYKSMEWQRRLGLARKVPEDIQMMIGSQWWCLRRETIEKVLAFCDTRPDVMRFFRTTWIPDETFFQTVVRHVVPDKEIRTRTLTFLMFTDYGMPVTFYNDHYDLLLAQDYLFARKISPEATELQARLGTLWGETGVDFPISNEGRRLFAFLTGRGRAGHRFAPRFWEAETRLDSGKTLLVILCKKWHVAKRLIDQLEGRFDAPAFKYLFNEAGGLPDLGGIDRTVEKRNRHRKALLRMLYDYYGTDRLAICVDPSDFELMRDLDADQADVRFLDMGCRFTDDYLLGHARRVGLAGERTPREVIDRVLPTIRYDFQYESDRIRNAGFASLAHMNEGASLAANASALAGFLDIDLDAAREIAATDYLFVD